MERIRLDKYLKRTLRRAYLERGENDFLYRTEVPFPQHLRLLSQGEDALGWNRPDYFGHLKTWWLLRECKSSLVRLIYLQEEPFVRPNSRHFPVDLRFEGKDPRVGQQHWNASGLQSLEEPAHNEKLRFRFRQQLAKWIALTWRSLIGGPWGPGRTLNWEAAFRSRICCSRGNWISGSEALDSILKCSPIVFPVVLVAARVLQLAPALAVPARGD